MSESSRFIIEPEALEARLGEPGLRIVDASWYLPAQNRDPRAEYETAHIPGAVFFDQDEIADKASGLPHTVPAPEEFARHAGAMGISRDDQIVVYDGPGMFTAPRVWWLFRIMGVEKVQVLNGGFDGWRRDGRPVSADQPAPKPATFEPVFKADAIVRLDNVRRIIEDGSAQIADARAHGRFTGAEPEPRPGMRSGHMPGAFNVPVLSLSEHGRLKSIEDLRATLKKAGIDPAKPVVTTCGSGITAAAITLALHSLGRENNWLYDGSWSEWGGRDDTPVKKGAGIIDDSASSIKG